MLLIVDVAGRTLRIKAVELFPGPLVARLRTMFAQAQRELGGVNSGIGLIGSPGWVVAGSLALGALESALSSSSKKEGAMTLTRANDLLQNIRGMSKCYPIADLKHLDVPDAQAWTGVGEAEKSVEMATISFFLRGEFLESHGKTKADVKDGVVTIVEACDFISLGEDFVPVILEDESRYHVRWSQVTGYKIEDAA